MPDTAEHGPTCTGTTERRAAGKPIWAHKVNLADVFRNDGLTFTEKRDAIVCRIRASAWFKSYDECDDLPQFVEELADTKTATSSTARGARSTTSPTTTACGSRRSDGRQERHPPHGWHSADPTLKPWIESEAERREMTMRELLDEMAAEYRENTERLKAHAHIYEEGGPYSRTWSGVRATRWTSKSGISGSRILRAWSLRLTEMPICQPAGSQSAKYRTASGRPSSCAARAIR